MIKDIDKLLAAADFSPSSLQAPRHGVVTCLCAWLIRTFEPKIFVELGTHTGNSYFSFCQSVKENNLTTKCYAVDTWQGDEHAGNYGEEVFHTVNDHNQTHYSSFSILLQMTFDEALACFSDASVELLHIDGLHTYDAVTHDFKSWLPKLAPDAVVLFHDINVRDKGFGVWRLWEELQASYENNFEFLHSNGLGVLQLNDAPEHLKLPWLDTSLSERQQLKEYFSALGKSQLVLFQRGQKIAEQQRLISTYHHAAIERDALIDEMTVTLAEQKGLINNYHNAAIERDAKIDEMTATLAEQKGLINNYHNAAIERDAKIDEMTATLAERDRLITDYHHAALDRDRQLAMVVQEVGQLITSTSWKITAPVRFAGHQVKRVRHLSRILPGLIDRNGGLLLTMSRTSKILRGEGLTGLKWRLRMMNAPIESPPVIDESGELVGKTDYQEWVRRYDTLDDDARQTIRGQIDSFSYRPTISLIMPVYDPPLDFLDQAIWSVRKQLYPDWQLCIADDASKNQAVRDLLTRHAAEDARIKLVFRQENGHIAIASNSALELAHGEFIAMFDHDDEISEHALYLIAEQLNQNRELDFMYSDQDKIDIHGVRYDPYFKSAFNIDLLRSQNFVDHLAVFRTTLLRKLGGWRTEFNGSQDYDMVLRFTERLAPESIRHIPFVLYHWRAVPGSLAIDAGAKNYAAERSRAALSEHLQRLGIEAEVTSHFPKLSIHRVIYPLPEEPLVSIIIPTKDGTKYLRRCVDGLFSKTDYLNIELIIVNNQSKEPETYDYFQELADDPRVRIIDYDQPFNYSDINNMAADQATGSVLALVNDDIEVINTDWLREMVSHAMRPEIGAVGARLYYPDGTVQHAGVLLGYNGRAGHMYRYASPHWLGYWARGVLIQNLTAVTAACMVVRKEIFAAVGGFDAENFTVTFNDVDLCLRLHEKGYRNLYTPYAELYHHESKTRGLLAIQSEEDYFSQKWQPYLVNDPAYNPNLSLVAEDFSLAFPPRVQRPWREHDRQARIVTPPLVTIVTRTHGERREFLQQALASIMAQTFRPIQIVVVEDGTENARSTVASLSPPDGITIDYASLPKRGRCYAGNRGLEMAEGEIAGFLDDDDLLLPDHLESLVKHLLLHPQAVGAYACSWEIPTELTSLSPLQYKEGKKRLFGRAHFSLSALWNYNYISIQSLLFRKELFQKFGGLSEDLECLEDWDLWLRYTAEGDFVFLDQVTSAFRMPKNETVLQDRRKQHMQYLPILRKRQKDLFDHYQNTPHYERLKAAFNTSTAAESV